MIVAWMPPSTYGEHREEDPFPLCGFYMVQVAVWLSGSALESLVRKPSQYVNSHPGRQPASLAIPLWVGRHN